jgi:hypothetical protein
MGGKLDELMKKFPPGYDQSWNFWLCEHVPPGNACKGCPVMNESYCEVFEKLTTGKKLKDCIDQIKPCLTKKEFNDIHDPKK